MTARPTPAQVAALRLALAGPVFPVRAGARGLALGTIKCLTRAGFLAQIGGHWRWTITDAGRDVLAGIDADGRAAVPSSPPPPDRTSQCLTCSQAVRVVDVAGFAQLDDHTRPNGRTCPGTGMIVWRTLDA